MSDHDEPGQGELERRLDAAFQATRPRRGFEDELWARLRARRPWWQRLGDRLEHVPWGGVATGLAALLVVGLVVTLVRLGSHGSSNTASTAAAPIAASGTSGASRAGAAAEPSLPFGPLPPPSAGGDAVVRPPGPSALPQGTEGASVQGAIVPPPPPSLAVYRYPAASGPANGTILAVNALPAGLTVGYYPSRPAADAVAAAQAARAAQAPGQAVVLTQARLVYVAVVSGDVGFLEPAYLFTGTASGAPAPVLVSALAASALR